MDPKLKQMFQEVTQLIEHVRRETLESHGYLNRNDHASALRNMNDCEDELKRLTDKWRDLLNELERRR